MGQYKILDLFAGAGGLSLGFEMFKDDEGNPLFEVHRAVEIDPIACETLRLHHGKEKVIEGDITKRSVQKKIIDDCRGKVTIVMGGIPCQSFSLIGPRSGFGVRNEKFKDDERDHLYKDFKRIVKAVNPDILVVENVKGILSKKDKDGEKIITKIIKDLRSLGYTLKVESTGLEYTLLNAADYGVPQERERVIIIGIKKELKISPPFLQPTHASREVLKDLQKQNISTTLLPHVTVHDAIGDLPRVSPKITATDLSKTKLAEIAEINKRTNAGADHHPIDRDALELHLMKRGPAGKAYFGFVRHDRHPFIEHHVTRPQQYSDIELFRLMRQGEVAGDFLERYPRGAKLIKYGMESFKDKYRKQSWSRPSTTIFAHLQKDGNRFIHPGQARTFTPREAARLQSFPDSYVFTGSVNQKFKQIGNAVPPILANRIAASLAGVLRKKVVVLQENSIHERNIRR